MRRLVIAIPLVVLTAGCGGGDEEEKPRPKPPNDIPKSLGKRALAEGGLLLPGDEDQFVTVPDATVLGRLRLSR